MKFLLDDGNQHVDAESGPDLGLHSVLACAQKVLDAQVLLGSLEKEFDLPAVLLECCDSGGRQTGVIGQEDQRFFGVGVGEQNTPNVFGIVLDGIEAHERHALIGDHLRASYVQAGVNRI